MDNKPDRKEYLRQYYQAHKERYKENALAWRKANPDKVREINRRQYERLKVLKQKGADTSSVKNAE